MNDSHRHGGVPLMLRCRLEVDLMIDDLVRLIQGRYRQALVCERRKIDQACVQEFQQVADAAVK